ncbi:MAG: hypothetical protein AAF962_27210 [Actinomycetota bacterium]
MTLITPRRTEPPSDLQSKRTYYASLWGTGSAKARARDWWLDARAQSMRLAIGSSCVLAVYLVAVRIIG